jgi:hypothetical protein
MNSIAGAKGVIATYWLSRTRAFLRVARHSLGAAEWHFGRVGKSLPTQGLEIVNRIAVSFRSDGVRETTR